MAELEETINQFDIISNNIDEISKIMDVVFPQPNEQDQLNNTINTPIILVRRGYDVNNHRRRNILASNLIGVIERRERRRSRSIRSQNRDPSHRNNDIIEEEQQRNSLFGESIADIINYIESTDLGSINTEETESQKRREAEFLKKKSKDVDKILKKKGLIRIPKKISKMKELVECIICRENVKDLCLPCGHSFCHLCITKCIKNKCPDCRSEYETKELRVMFL